MKLENLNMNRNRKIMLIGVMALIIIVMFAVMITRKTSSATSENIARDGYKTILDVPGAQFEVKKDLSDYSTAVMEISRAVDFLDYQTYSYKNGQDTYLLFNIRNYIVLVSKGTEFDFDTNGITDSLSKHSINGIWFSEYGKDPVKVATKERYEVEVEAQVVITNAVYNDFYGTLTTLNKDGQEWTMFAGCVSGAAAEYKDIMNYISSTFALCDENQYVMGAYTVDEEGHFVEVQEESESIQIAEVTPIELEPIKEPQSIVPAETSTPLPTEEPTSEELLSATSTPEITVPPSSPAPTQVPAIEIDESTDVFELKENQKHIKKDMDKVYTSSIYNMLSLNETGYISIMGDYTGGFQEAYVKATRIYDAEETEKLIKQHIDSGNSYYTSMEPPMGTHFEAVEYDVNFLDEEKSYVNVSLCGVDGEDLRFRGIIYPHMTYDINENVSANGEWMRGHIAFYAVPNGCKEYVIKVGDALPDDIAYFATYYKIER